MRRRAKTRPPPPKKETFYFLSITLTTKNITFMFLFLFEVVVGGGHFISRRHFSVSLLSLKCEKKEENVYSIVKKSKLKKFLCGHKRKKNEMRWAELRTWKKRKKRIAGGYSTALLPLKLLGQLIVLMIYFFGRNILFFCFTTGILRSQVELGE